MKITKENIAAMLAEGIPQADCARILGRSRQRIAQYTTVQMMGAYKKAVRKQRECLKSAIKRKIAVGMSKKDIADDLCIPKTLYYRLMPSGTIHGNTKREIRTAILLMAKKGFAVGDIAKELGMKQNNVRRYLAAMKINVKDARFSV